MVAPGFLSTHQAAVCGVKFAFAVVAMKENGDIARRAARYLDIIYQALMPDGPAASVYSCW